LATAWVVPFAFFWPVAANADFFGQWNNIFMRSALALAMAAVQSRFNDQ
jgi:succinate dehydrogenase hydrophobic anchor subunit